MSEAEGRALRPHRPWPTARKRRNRTLKLVTFLATIQFGLSALQNILPDRVMFWAWTIGMAVVAVGTVQIEKYFGRRRNME